MRLYVCTLRLCLAGDGKEHYYVDFDDQVARGSCVLHNGEMMWPPPKIADPSPPPRPKVAEAAAVAEPNYFMNTFKDASMYTAGLSGMVGESKRKVLIPTKVTLHL